MASALRTVRSWQGRQWLIAAAAAVVTVVLIAVPTALLPTPLFGRSVPPEPWSWPVTLLTGVLSGLVLATYVGGEPTERLDRAGRSAGVGGLLAFLAVGCPVCNKVVLIALGSAGALQYFAPVQPWLAAAGVIALAVALLTRLRSAQSCPVAQRPVAPRPVTADPHH